MKRILQIALLSCMTLAMHAQDDGLTVIDVGEHSTTHVLFMSDLTYVDVSTPEFIAAKVVDASKNMLALKARKPFEVFTTVSALEANGTMHTFKVRYDPFPKGLLVDTRTGTAASASGQINTQVRPGAVKKEEIPAAGAEAPAGSGVDITSTETSNFGRGDAPTLEEVMRRKQQLFHIGDKNFGIEAFCVNVYVYSDLTYLVISLKNNTDIGFEAGDAQFTIENLNPNMKSLATDKTVWIKSSHGSLSCPPRGKSKVGYTIPKLTLLKGECLKVYIYEKSGNRNLILTLTDNDINYAVSPK
ncbi:MAG: DUF4138 domain-containing protein [Bacteroidales bacterium]|nr:DUF4138 domain-containing protein [Bacteroidales bacterium]